MFVLFQLIASVQSATIKNRYVNLCTMILTYTQYALMQQRKNASFH